MDYKVGHVTTFSECINASKIHYKASHIHVLFLGYEVQNDGDQK